MVMCKPNDHNIAIEEEFLKLEQVLNQTANETANCLKLLKKHLSDYDSRNGNRFRNTAASFMRTDMRDAKDTAMDLKHVAHEINRDQKPTKTEIASARNMMNSTARAIETLKATARNYDRENQQRMGVKGRVDAAVGGHGERSAFAASSSSSSSESDGGLFGKKDSGEKRRNISNEDNNGGRVVGSSETVETLVRKVLRDNFSLSTLNSQIKAAENSLTPSLMERAKEKMHDVKEKIKGDKSEPVHEGHGYPHEGHHHQQTVMP